MKKHNLTFLIGGVIGLCLTCSSCVVKSIYPFFTEDVLVALPEIQGEWMPQFDDIEEPWVFQEESIEVDSQTKKERELKITSVVTVDKKKRKDELKVLFFKLKGVLFANFLSGNHAGNDYSQWTIFPVHTLFKVDLGEKELNLTPLDIEWFAEEIKEKRLPLPYIKTDPNEEEGHFLLTATPEVWMPFLEKNHEIIFSKKKTLKFLRKE